MRGSRFAIVLRTFEWDGFVTRQIARYRSANPGADLFVSLDSTRPTGAPEDERIVRAGTAELLRTGLPNRFGKGSLVWWNNDYWYYDFRARYRDYDYYVLVEYDSVVQGSLATLVEAVASRDLDFVAAPIPGRLADWSWWSTSRLVYPENVLRASINCVAVLSAGALDHLFRQRLAMAADPSVTHWPISEAFVATELERAGLRSAPLAAFGDTRDYDWFTPMLEDDLPRDAGDGLRFFHPVLDGPRYLASVVRFGHDLRPFLARTGAVRRSLARLPAGDAARLLLAAARRRLVVNRADRANARLLAAGRLPGW